MGLWGLKHVETQRHTNKIVTSFGFHSICNHAVTLHACPIFDNQVSTVVRFFLRDSVSVCCSHPQTALGEDGPGASTERGDVYVPVHG